MNVPYPSIADIEFNENQNYIKHNQMGIDNIELILQLNIRYYNKTQRVVKP